MPTDAPAVARRRRRVRATAARLSPSLLLRQIVLLQLFYYASLLLLIFFSAEVFGAPFSLSLLFSWRTIRGDTAFGWTICLLTLVGGALAGSIALMVFVGRSKLVLDFVLTLHFLHAVIVIFLWPPEDPNKQDGSYAGTWPRNRLWWILQLGSCVSMLLGGMAGCRWRELKPIGFGESAGSREAALETGPSEDHQGLLHNAEADEQSFEMNSMAKSGATTTASSPVKTKVKL